tara:strand:+ start:2454 stop:3410 length:957 start_codon:yes stop_codon:yes gene_type:complete
MDTRLIVADILEGNLGDAKSKTDAVLYQKSGEILEGFSYAVMENVYGLSEASKKKAKVTDKDDDGEGMDPVGAEDDDIDNDGDSDDSDEYLKNRRKTVKKAIAKDNGDEEEATEGYGKKMKKEEYRDMNGNIVRPDMKKVKKEEEEGKKKKKGSHNCANHVEHAEWGQGIPVHGEHAPPDEDGYIQWYNVEFEHGIEEHVFTEDLTILSEAMHEDHDHHEGEQLDELVPLALGAAKMMLGTKAGLAATGYMMGKAVQKKTMRDKQRVASSGGVGASEGVDVDEDMEIYGVDREKYAKMSDQEKQSIKQAYRAKKAVSK